MATTMGPLCIVQQNPSALNTFTRREKSEPREHIFRSKLPDIELSNHMNLADYTFEKVAGHLDHVALIDGPTGKEWTYRETQILSKKVAVGLTKLGIAKGDVIALLLPNCAEFVFCLLGSAARGSVVATCNPFYTEREIKHQLNLCKPKLIVTQAAFVDKVQDLGLMVVTIDPPLDGALPISVLFENDENEGQIIDIDSGEVVCLPFSSGTSGLPKGVMLTHKSLISGVAQQVDGENPAVHFNPNDVAICLSPMFHIYSLSAVLLCSLRSGCTIVIMPLYSTVPHFFEMVQKYSVSIVHLSPPLLLGIAKSPVIGNYVLSSIRKVMSAAAPLGKELTAQFKAKLPNAVVGQAFGMTEAGPGLSYTLNLAKYPVPVKPGSCGTVVRNAELKLIDPVSGVSYTHNHPGEICIRGPQIMKGYLDNHEATENAIDKEGWLHTGDIAIIDKDEEIFIIDRAKEIIKYGGSQVPPSELEALLMSHTSILDAAVVPMKDETVGQVPAAFVVTQDKTITEASVKEFISKQVIFYKRLQAVYFVESIPRSAAGKILRKNLIQLLETLRCMRPT